jgi:hypothetical protein
MSSALQIPGFRSRAREQGPHEAGVKALLLVWDDAQNTSHNAKGRAYSGVGFAERGGAVCVRGLDARRAT